jgi:hypothetical protein
MLVVPSPPTVGGDFSARTSGRHATLNIKWRRPHSWVRRCNAVFLDFELERRGEDELSAAMRLIRGVIRNAPRAFSGMVLSDSLYAGAPMVGLSLAHRKDVIVVLKDQRRELLQDARGLRETELPKEFTRECAGRT